MERSLLERVRLLGKGSFAHVHLCHMTGSPLKKIAAKVVQVNGDIRLLFETENEIEILQDLNHENIVEFLGALRRNEEITILLAYAAGGEFFDGILGWSQFGEHVARLTARQLLLALRFLKEKRIAHRDLSPGNILWHTVPSNKCPKAIPLLKIIDFNLSRRIPEEMDFLRSDPVGNTPYMAPECLSDKPLVTFSSDIWAVGVILFMLLGGYPPFWSSNYNHLVQNILEANYVTPYHLWNDVTQDAKHLLSLILCKEHKERCTADELLSHKWFEKSDFQGHLSSHRRLKSFLEKLNNDKEDGSNRKYSLTVAPRTAYVPDDLCIVGEDENNNYIEEEIK